MSGAPFEVPSEAAWQEAALAASKRSSLEELTETLPGGLRIEPLYVARHSRGVARRGEPGAAPFVRGSGLVPGGWLVGQRYRTDDVEQAAEWIGGDVAAGVEGVLLSIRRELSDAECAKLAEASGGASALLCEAGEHAPVVARRLERHAPGRVSALYDPHGTLGLFGRMASGSEGALDAAASLVQGALATASATGASPPPRALAVGANLVHEAGGHPALELGFALAAAAELVRGLVARGLPAAEAARQIALVVASEGDVLLGVAKLRALRLSWTKVLVALGVEGPPPPLVIGITSRRSLSRLDVATNLVRGTNETTSLILGGADVVVTRPFDDVTLDRGRLGRRIAKNTQLVLREESHLDQVRDPAGGSHFVESLTDAIARRGWDELRAIEREGGLFASLDGGGFGTRVREEAAELGRTVRTRRRILVGVNDFVEPHEPVASSAGARTPRADGEVALIPMREAAGFESVRERAYAMGQEGTRPRALLVCLGTPTEHRAREEFCRRFFEAGGFEVERAGEVDGTAWVEAAVRGRAASVAILCSSDGRYAELAADAALCARRGGASHVLLAGKPGALQGELDEAGLAGSVHLGCDAVLVLEGALGAAASHAAGGAA